MKMSANLFNDLKNDCEMMVNFGCENKPQTMKDMWKVFHSIMFERMNDDTHPAFANGRPRILAFWSRNGEKKEMQGNDHWLNRFYVEENLNDDHIETALKKIKKELWGC